MPPLHGAVESQGPRIQTVLDGLERAPHARVWRPRRGGCARLRHEGSPSPWPFAELRFPLRVAPRREGLPWNSCPREVAELLIERHVVDERGELPVEKRPIHLLAQRDGEAVGSADPWRPRRWISRDALEPVEGTQKRG